VMASNFASKTPIKVDVTIDAKTYKDVGARHRGFSSYHFLPRGKEDKRPWKLLFDEFVDGQDVQGYRTLNINNNVWDPSFMREVATFEFMRRYTKAPKSCFVKLKVNGEDLGLFTNTQQINKDFLQEHYRDDEGNRYRGDRTGSSTLYDNSALIWLGSNPANYYPYYELKTENGKYPAWTKLVSLANTLNNTSIPQLPSALPKELDIDNTLRFLAVANMTAWLDSYLGRTCKNFYLYEDPFHGQFSLQPWDVNNAFGGLTDGLGTTGVARLPVLYRENDTRNPRPLFSQLVKIPMWRARYLAHMRTMLPEMHWDRIGKRIEELRTHIRPALTADTKRIYTLQQFDDNVTKSVFVGFVTTPGLKPFFDARHSYLSSDSDMVKVAPTLSSLAHTPANPKPSEAVTVTARVSGISAKDVTLHHRVRGPFAQIPMLDDGQHGDGAANDGVYGAFLPAMPALSIIEYFVTANSDLNAASGAMSVLPSTGSYGARSYRVLGVRATGPIVISELLAKNTKSGRDENNEYDDWIELMNVSNQAVTVSGMYLTDNSSNPTKWKIPSGHTLAPGASLLVWADEDGTQGPLHANFKLSASGEEVALFATDGTTNLDWIEFGPQLSDRSLGRLPGYLDRLFGFPLPTPNAPNETTPCGHTRFVTADTSVTAFDFDGLGLPKLGQAFDLAATSGPASGACAVFVGLPRSTDVPVIGTLLLDPSLLIFVGACATDATGAGKLPVLVPTQASLAGARVHFQAVGIGSSGLRFSGGVQTLICP
ncbi:MAG: CotH kinase family protein, partial [Planctomycetes bacterium]|nr:CotH kinase family protein [Planctomycetota bacterium]